jgi:hypothetical protein
MPISLSTIIRHRPDVQIRVSPISDLIHIDLLCLHEAVRADLFDLRDQGLEVFSLHSDQQILIRATGLDHLAIAERISTHLEIEYNLRVQRLIPDPTSRFDPEMPIQPIQSFLFV